MAVTTSSPVGGAHRKKSAASRVRGVVMPLLLVLAGLVVMLYPVISSTWNNFAQQKVAVEYEKLMEKEDPATLNQIIEDARRFNAEHTPGPILDPWEARNSDSNELYQLYLSQLSAQQSMSQVVIPAINSRLPVRHGTDADTLQRGLGHLFGSSLPIGGEGTHTVITGHTGITNATLWDNLIELKKGDAIYVSTYGERMKYEVHSIDTVLPDETGSLAIRPGEDLITLITCTPYGVNSHRLLVHGHRVPMDPSDEEVFEKAAFTFQWWMWLVLGASLLVLVLMLLWVIRQLKKKKESR